MAQTGEILKIRPDGTTAFEPAPQSPRRVISPYLEPMFVTPGEYRAIYAGHHGLNIFRGKKLLVLWQLFEHPDIQLPRYYRVETYHPRVSARASSDLVRELEAALGRRIVRRDRISIADLEGVIVRVKVRTVTRDRSQRDLAEVSRYSVIERVVGRE